MGGPSDLVPRASRPRAPRLRAARGVRDRERRGVRRRRRRRSRRRSSTRLVPVASLRGGGRGDRRWRPAEGLLHLDADGQLRMGARHQQALRHRSHRLPHAAAAHQGERPPVPRAHRRAPRGARGGGGDMRHVATSPTAALRALDLTPGTVALWWLGQAGFAMRAGGLVLLIDPFLAQLAERLSLPAFDPEDAVDVDVVACSHEHYDHLDLASLPAIARASPKARFVVPRPLVDAVAAAGIQRARIIGAQPDERIRLDGVTLHPLPARHGVGMADAYGFGRELSGGLYRFLGFVVDDGIARIYHAGDTVAYDGQVERLRALRVDVA